MSKFKLARQLAFAGASGFLLAAGALAETVPLTVKPDASADVPEIFRERRSRYCGRSLPEHRRRLPGMDSGVQDEAERLGVNLTVYNADGDSAKVALHLHQAVATKPDGILIGWGFGDSLASGP